MHNIFLNLDGYVLLIGKTSVALHHHPHPCQVTGVFRQSPEGDLLTRAGPALVAWLGGEDALGCWAWGRWDVLVA